MKKTLCILLSPFSFFYGLILCLRNLFFDVGILRSTLFNFPIIAVGNLNIGGVGKTPHVEYLLRLLSTNFKVSTLSRGYKRRGTGFVLATNDSTINDIGDEPLQYKKKFNTIPVAVDEKRVRGIQSIKEAHPDIEIVILDDAYQHRYVTPGINILVTDYNNLYINDCVLPAGRLREWKSSSKRADIIIVSKSPSNLSVTEQAITYKNLSTKPYQTVYFSSIKYGRLSTGNEAAKELSFTPDEDTSILLITGIANPTPLLIHIKKHHKNIHHLQYKDHYEFTTRDIAQLKNKFHQLPNNKIVITTEKDFMRLSLPEILITLKEIPLFYLPIEVYFHGSDQEKFNTQIVNYVTQNSKK